MTELEKVIKGIFEMLQRNTWKDIDDERHKFQTVLNDALKLLKEQNGLMLALEQSNASNEYLNNSVSELGETINILKDEIKRLKEQQPKKGEWLKDYTYRKDHPRNYCSVCNMTGGFRTDYCPNCGAYMRKDGEQE